MIKNKNLYKKVWEEFKNNKSFLITSHINPDGDAICSQILVASILRKFGKKYNIIMEDSFPERFRFILQDYYEIVVPELVNVPKGVDLLTQLPENYFPEVVLIIDSGGTDRLGEFAKYFDRAKKIINIDHHTGDRHYKSSVNLIDINASSTGEIIYDLMENNNYKIDRNSAVLIYIAIVTDTRFFTQANTTSRAHKITSYLIENGVVPEELSYQLEEVPPDTLRVFGKVLGRLKTELDNKIIWSYISESELKKCRSRDIDGLVELLRGTTDTKVAILFKVIGKDKIKVSMRGKYNFDVFRIASEFGGGGHIQAAGCTIKGKLDDVVKIIIDKFKKIVK